MTLLNQTMNNKAQFDLYNYQSVTGLKSPTYSGYGMSASSIVNLEASQKVTETFLETNKILGVEVKAMSTSIEALVDGINDFKSSLVNFSGMDLNKITPDVTGGEISFTNNDDVYNNQTITIDGKQYTFSTDAAAAGDLVVNISGLTPGTETYGQEVMQALYDKIQEQNPNPDIAIDGNKMTFPLYTVNGTSSILNVDGVTLGEAHTMSGDQYQSLKELQNLAFSTMKLMVDSLNTYANGKYLFGGGVSDTAPVNFPFKTLQEFQDYYDGKYITYPQNDTANLSNRTINNTDTGGLTLSSNGDGKGVIKADKAGGFLKQSIVANAETTGNLTFNSDKNTINATEYGAFNTLKPGDTLVIGDAGDTHNGSYIIKSISADGKTITFEDSTPIRADDVIANGGGATFSTSFAVGSIINMDGFGKNIASQVQVTGGSADGTELYVSVDPGRWPSGAETVTMPDSSRWSMGCDSYYKGGNLITEKRISDNQSITMDINANDPAFEKLFRALGEIAQGNLVDERDPAESLDSLINPEQTADRVTEALDLIQEALFSAGKVSNAVNPDIYTVQAKLNANSVIMNNTDENLTLVNNNLANSISSMKNVDKTEAAVKALLAATNLEASYSVLQNAMNLTLLNYLK